MAPEVFIDTSGFYALLARGDARHGQAAAFMHAAAGRKGRFATTDYVVDEMATVLQARGMVGVAPRLCESVFGSRACRVVWMDPERFERTKALFLRHLGQGWSFTDCLSFVVMGELRIHEALTKDAHFVAAGFTALLT